MSEQKELDKNENIPIVPLNIAYIKGNEKLHNATDQIQEQLNLIRNQIQNTKSIMQNKTQTVFENARNQIIDRTKQIESEIEQIRKNAVILEDDLLDTQNHIPDHNISFFREILRKTIHICSLSIPICYTLFSKESMLMVLVPLMVLVIFTDIATKRNVFLRTIYLKTFGPMLRKHELKSQELLLNGASWVMISSVLTIYFFPQLIAIVGLSILFISDIVAAIVGRRFGNKRFLALKHKSWVGTLSFFVSAYIVVSVYGFILNMSYSYYIIGIIAAAAAAFAEAIATEVLRTDDNLAIPIAFGIFMWVGNIFISYI